VSFIRFVAFSIQSFFVKGIELIILISKLRIHYIEYTLNQNTISNIKHVSVVTILDPF